MGYLCGVALLVATCRVAAGTVVRRASVYGGEETDKSDQKAAHCVVWGEKHLKGIKFSDKAMAEATFKSVKRTQNAAARFKGLVEVQRYMSPRLTSVNWRQLRKWCSQDLPNAEQPALLQEDMPSEKPPKPEHAPSFDDQEPSREEQSALGEIQEQPSPKRKRQKQIDTSSSDDSALEEQDEEQVRPSRKKRRSRSMADGDDDGYDEDHLRSRDRLVLRSHHTSSDDDEEPPPRKKHHHTRSDDDEDQPRRKKRPTYDSMEDKPAPKKRRPARSSEFALLEADAGHHEHHEHHGHHEHNHAEPSFLGKASLAGTITSLDKAVASLASEAGDLSKRMGARQSSSILESATLESDSEGAHHARLKDRLVKTERSISNVHTVLSSLEGEMLGHSGSLPKAKKANGLKNKAASLEQHVNNLRDRITTLKKEESRVFGEVDKLEASMDKLSSKAAALCQSIGNAEAAPGEQQRPDQDASFADRVILLEGYAEKLQASVGSLEVELRGAEARAPPKSPKGEHVSDKLKFLQTFAKSLKGRLTSLEQEV